MYPKNISIMITLIKGTDLTTEQKNMLKFFGMAKPEWVENHSFYFEDGKPSKNPAYYYPVCHALTHLQY